MIYKINGKNLTSAMVNGGGFIAFSYNGVFALVRSQDPINDALEVYEESELQILFNDPLYKQPCKDC
jgi:hypothetical protein